MAKTAPPHNARCPHKACPVRWRDGEDRPCSEHQDDGGIWADRMTDWTGTMAAPGEPYGDGDGESDGDYHA